MLKVLLTASLLLLSTAALAQPYLFASAGTEQSSDVGVGYAFTRHFAGELAYFRSEDAGVRTSGGGFAALGSLPLGEKLSAFARLGLYSLTAKTSGSSAVADAVTGSPAIAATSTGHEWTTAFGVGAQYALHANFAVRLLAEQYSEQGAIERISRVALGGVLRF